MRTDDMKTGIRLFCRAKSKDGGIRNFHIVRLFGLQFPTGSQRKRSKTRLVQKCFFLFCRLVRRRRTVNKMQQLFCALPRLFRNFHGLFLIPFYASS